MKTSHVSPTILAAAIATLPALAYALPQPQVLRVDSGRADRGRVVTTDAVGNAYVAGSIERTSQRSDFAVVKYDSRGARVWEAHHSGSLGGPGGEARAVAVDAAGNVFTAGFARTTVNVTSTVNAMLVKFTPEGAEQWARRVGSGVAVRTAVDAAGNVYVAGTTFGADSDWTTQKYSSGGALLWERRFDGTLGNNDVVVDLALDAAGNVVVTGWTDSSDSLRGATDIATVKYSPQGDTVWQRVFTTDAASDEKPFDLAIDNAGTVYVAGVASSDTSGELPVTAVTLAYDNQGTLRFRQSLGGQAVSVGAAGEIVVTGFTSPDGAINTVCPPRAHIARLGPSGVPVWTTCLPGIPRDVAVNGQGDIFVIGGGFDTQSLDYHSGAIVAQDDFNSSASGREESVDAHLDAFGNLYVTGVAFTSVISASADMLTLKFAEGGGAPPTTGPAAPSGLTATADARSVALRWIDNSSNEDGFSIERCQGGSCTNFVQIAQVNADQSSFLDTGRRANTRYRYRVRAFNDAGNSAYTNIVNVQTPRR